MQGHVYHWRHGWIPLTHYAALQKAHGSHKGAAKYLSQSNGMHGTESHKLGGKLEVGQYVHARQPGIDHVTSGKVVGHDANGMVQVKYMDRHGKDTVGTFNPAHVEPMSKHESDYLAQQERMTNAHVVARTRPNPSAGDWSDAAEKWKRENPDKRIAGHEREVERIANDLWRAKRLKGPDTGDTKAQQDAHKERVKQAMSHSHRFKSLGMDKPKVIEEPKTVSTPEHVAQLKIGDVAHVKGESHSVPGQRDSVIGKVTNVTTQVRTSRGRHTGDEVKAVEVQHERPSGMPGTRVIVIPTGRKMIRTDSGWKSKDEVAAAKRRVGR